MTELIVALTVLALFPVRLSKEGGTLTITPLVLFVAGKGLESLPALLAGLKASWKTSPPRPDLPAPQTEPSLPTEEARGTT